MNPKLAPHTPLVTVSPTDATVDIDLVSAHPETMLKLTAHLLNERTCKISDHLQ